MTCRTYQACGKSDAFAERAPTPTGEPVIWPSAALGAGRLSADLSTFSGFDGGAALAIRCPARGGSSFSPGRIAAAVRGGNRGEENEGSGSRTGSFATGGRGAVSRGGAGVGAGAAAGGVGVAGARAGALGAGGAVGRPTAATMGTRFTT